MNIQHRTDEHPTSNIERPTSNKVFCPSRASGSNDQFKNMLNMNKANLSDAI
jgi:hypothetical protein